MVSELRVGDIVSHERHGEGVILAIGEWDIEVCPASTFLDTFGLG
jgi:hypothetical protein